MAYERLDLKTGDELNEAVFKHIDDSIERIYDDLYDIKIDTSYTLVSQTCNIESPSYKTVWNYSTFSGWCACMGKPSVINRIQFPVLARTDAPIESFTVEIYEFAELADLTINTRGVTPNPKSWTMLGNKTITLENAIVDTSNYTIITVDFDETIVNANNKYLMCRIFAPVTLTMGMVEVTYDDIPYNPWYYYAAGGRDGCTAVSSGTYDSTSTTILCLPVAIYSKSVSEPYTTIGTARKDKFHELVNEALNNSESFGSLFDSRQEPSYLIGSQNVISNTSFSTPDSNRAFRGVVFPVGVIPSDITIYGVSIPVTAGSYNSSTSAVTKVNCYLYSVEAVPENADAPTWASLEPTLLRETVVNANIAIGETAVVDFTFEVPFVNTENKFLMLGYSVNSYISRTKISSGKSHATICAGIDGGSYTNLRSWYCSKANSGSWSYGFNNDSSNAWSFVSFKTVYDFGENFYSILDEAIAEVVGDTQVQTAPTSEVRLAKQYDVVVGDTFQLFYEGVIKSFAPLNEGIRVVCSVGKQLARYFEFTPTETNSGKTYTLTLSTRRLDGTVISTGSTKIVVHPKLTNETTPENLNVLFFGDSLTSGGVWCAEGLRRIYGATDSEAIGPVSDGVTNTVTSYGAKTHTQNTFKINHEGYSGWMWSNFITTSTESSTSSQMIVVFDEPHGYDLDIVQKSSWTDNNGLEWELEEFPSDNSIKFNRGEGNTGAQNTITLPTSLNCDVLSLSITNFSDINWSSNNPFYNELTGELDFAYHAEKYGNAGADIVSCLLTWNGAQPSGTFDNTSKISNHMNNATTLLRQIHTDLPNAKIICMGIQISDLNGGCGSSYGATGSYSDTWATAFYAFDYNKALEELCTNEEFKEYCYYVDTKGQFDSRYNMPANRKAVNTRNSSITEWVGTNGVHAYNGYESNGYGYYQIGDALYRALTKVIPTFATTE